MADQNIEAAANQMQNLFRPLGNQDMLKTFANMNERITAIIVEAGTRSIDIMSETTKESLSNLSEATQVRDELADYSKAYSEFAQKQMDLLKRSAQEIGEVARMAGTETTELTSNAGEELGDKVAAKVDVAADKAGSAAKKAA